MRFNPSHLHETSILGCVGFFNIYFFNLFIFNCLFYLFIFIFIYFLLLLSFFKCLFTQYYCLVSFYFKNIYILSVDKRPNCLQITALITFRNMTHNALVFRDCDIYQTHIDQEYPGNSVHLKCTPSLCRDNQKIISYLGVV